MLDDVKNLCSRVRWRRRRGSRWGPLEGGYPFPWSLCFDNKNGLMIIPFLCSVTHGINQLIYEPERQIVLPNWDTFMVYLAGATVTRWSERYFCWWFVQSTKWFLEKLIIMKTMTIDDLMIFLLWLVLLVWCKREIDSGDVEVDVGQAGNGIVEL